MAQQVGVRRPALVDRAAGILIRARLLAAQRLSALDVLFCGLILAGVGGLVFGSHVIEGGFYYDDWANAAYYRYAPDSGFFGAVDHFMSFTAYRPLLAVYVPLTHAVFGLHMGHHLAWSLALAVLMSTCLYAVLRTLGMERLHAAVLAALVLIFPAADATVLWSTAGMTHVSISLYLLGLLTALRGLRASGRYAVLWHAGAVSLYAASVLTYEITAGMIMLSVLVYAFASSWRAALRRWPVDAVAVGLILLLVTSDTTQEVQPLADQLRHTRTIVDQALHVLASATLPFGTPRRETVLALLAATALAGVLVWWLLPASDAARGALRRWLLTAGAAVVATAAGYVMFVPADPYYSPLTAGLGNRVNVLASIGLVLLVYSLAMVAGILVFRGLPHWRTLSAGLAVSAALVLGIGYARNVDRDKQYWEDAFAAEQHVLGVVKQTLGDPPPGATIYVFGQAGWTAPGVPIFASSWDFNGAVKVTWDDPSLEGYPIFGGTPIVCGQQSFHPAGSGYGPVQGARYGRAFFVDVAAPAVTRVRDRRTCRSAARRLGAKPLEPLPG